MKGVATAITMKILIPIFMIALLIGGWFYYSKNKSDMLAATGVEEITEDVTEPPVPQTDTQMNEQNGHDHAEGTDNESLLGEKGTATQITVDPMIGVRGVGDPNAPIKIQEFFSLTCNHCAAFHTGPYQELKAKYIDQGKVYFVYEEFPLNGPALYGSMIARCLPEERYTGFIDILLRNQEQWAFGGNFKVSLRQNAKLAGMSDEEFDACFNNKDLQNALAKNIAAASDAWNISSTPTFVINDGERIIRGAKSMVVFDAIVEEYANKKSAPAETAPIEAAE